MQWATLGKSGLQVRIARAFSSNSLVNTSYMMLAIQYILTAAQLLGVLKKILTWMLREARGGHKETVSNRVKPDYHFIHIVLFVLFCFFQPDSCLPWQAMLKSMSAHIGHFGPKPG